jgi:hypothetical protein
MISVSETGRNEHFMHKLINHPQPAVGLVIGTFAAVPYIHLALESWRLNYPAIPLLVSDDGSPNRDELHALCQRYGADFVSECQAKKAVTGRISAYSPRLGDGR